MTTAPNPGNGIRDENGSLIGGLYVFEYRQGMDDFDAGTPPPKITTVSYDLGRQRAAEKAGEKAFFRRKLAEDREESKRRMKEILPPEFYAQYERDMAKLEAKYPPYAL